MSLAGFDMALVNKALLICKLSEASFIQMYQQTMVQPSYDEQNFLADGLPYFPL